jgi:hypothetical protein
MDKVLIQIDITSFFLCSKAKTELVIAEEKYFTEIIMLEIIPKHKDTYRRA